MTCNTGNMVLPKKAVTMVTEEMLFTEGGRPLSKGQKKICQKAANRTKKIDRKVAGWIISYAGGRGLTKVLKKLP